MAKASRWEKRGDLLYLAEHVCYPGTQVYIKPSGYRRWRVYMCVTSIELRAGEAKREPLTVHSVQEWVLPVAKQKAIKVARDIKWLMNAGITFGDIDNG